MGGNIRTCQHSFGNGIVHVEETYFVCCHDRKQLGEYFLDFERQIDFFKVAVYSIIRILFVHDGTRNANVRLVVHVLELKCDWQSAVKT